MALTTALMFRMMALRLVCADHCCRRCGSDQKRGSLRQGLLLV